MGNLAVAMASHCHGRGMGPDPRPTPGKEASASQRSQSPQPTPASMCRCTDRKSSPCPQGLGPSRARTTMLQNRQAIPLTRPLSSALASPLAKLAGVSAHRSGASPLELARARYW